MISIKSTITVSVDVNTDVHSHFMAQIEGEFSPLNYGVTMFPVRLQNNTQKHLVFVNDNIYKYHSV